MPLALIIIYPDMGFGAMAAAEAPNRLLFMVGLMVIFGGFALAKGIQQDRMDGTIIRILAGPITMRSYLVQNFMSAMVPMTVLSLLIGILGVALNGWYIAFAAGVVICYILLAASSIGLAFAWSCLFKDKETSWAALSVVITAIATLGGLMIPLSLLPFGLRLVGALFPAQWAARALENIMEYGVLNTEFWLAMLAMLMFTIAFMLFGGKRRLI